MTTSKDDENLLDAEDVAAILKVSTDTVYHMARRGELPTVKFGRSVRFERPKVMKQIQRWAS